MTTGLPVDITWLLVADNGLVEGVAVSILTLSGYFVTNVLNVMNVPHNCQGVKIFLQLNLL